MVKKGRPEYPRTTELGLYIKMLRDSEGWSIKRLAKEAKISYKTLSKLELSSTRPRKPRILLDLANAFGVHPDQLLMRACLTPILKPPTVEVHHTERKSVAFIVDKEERRQLENYLHYLRYIASIESMASSINRSESLNENSTV